MDALQIKFEIAKKVGTLKKAAELLSNEEYSVSLSHLSKVVNGERKTNIIRVRVAKLLGQDVDKVFSN